MAKSRVVALQNFYRHQRFPQRTPLDKIETQVEKENQKKGNDDDSTGCGLQAAEMCNLESNHTWAHTTPTSPKTTN